MAPTKKQSSLDTFFGVQGGDNASSAKKKGAKQKRIESFFSNSKKNEDEQKENKQKQIIEDVNTPDANPSSINSSVVKRKSPTSEKKSTKRNKNFDKRKIIDDDSSDEEVEFEGNNNSSNKTADEPVRDEEMKPVSCENKDRDGSSEGEGEKTDTQDSSSVQSKESTNRVSAKKDSVKAIEGKDEKRQKEQEQPKKVTQITTQITKLKNNKGKESKEIKVVTSKDDSSSEKKDNKTKSKSKKIPTSRSLIFKAAKNGFKSDEEILDEITSTSWEAGMPYSFLCEAFVKIEAITGRLAIQEIMTTLFRQIMLKSGKDMTNVLYLASNSVAPAYECVELGIGDAILIKAIGEATGTNPSMVKEKYETVGDLGSVAQTCKGKQKTLGGFFGMKSTKTPLTVNEVLTTFREIANTKGNQSQKMKVDSIKKLLVRASVPAETKYIIRGLQGKLRIGLAESTVLIALAHSLALTIPETISDDAIIGSVKDYYPDEAKQFMDKKQTVEKRLEAAVSIVKKAYSEVPSYEAIMKAALKVPLQELHKECTLTPGIPVSPMLAKPTKSVQEVLTRLNGLKFTCEYKYDGERAQVHLLPDGTTKVFSRNLLDTSIKYPEVPLFVKEAAHDLESFVLDAEVVAFNQKTGQLVPFQILSTRKKTEESAETAQVQVIVQAFDLMYLNGESLLSKTLSERRALLQKHFKAVEGKFQFAKYLDHEENGDTTILEEFLDQAVKGQCEGLMIKTLDVNAIYEPSRRSLNWLKLKKDYLEGLGDSVDLVPLGAYHGRGKRTGYYGAYLVACYDPDTEEFQSVCKIGTGFSDEDLKNLTEGLNKHKIPTKSGQYNVSDQLECDVWFDAVQVWEVKAADLSKSSAHRGAEGKFNEAGRGIGLRFPRFERIRHDKKPEQATTSDQILEMYFQQDAVKADNDEGDDDGGGI